MMKKLLLATAATGLVLSTAFAQSPSSPPAGSPPAASQKQDMNQKQDAKPPAAAQKNDMSKPSTAAQKDDASKSGASAQKDDMSKPGASAQTQDMSKPGGSASADQQVVTSQKPDQLLASKFSGTDVIGADDKKIGDVSDVLFDKDGKVLAYVVSIGGFLGIGSKDVALAPNAFELVPGTNGAANKLKISMSQDQLKQMASFEAYQPPRTTTTGSSSSGGGLGSPKPASGAKR